jgi:hypothetical protein
MTHKIRITLVASAFALLVAFTPVAAFADRNEASVHVHTATVHDRTPTVHEHSSHSRRG